MPKIQKLKESKENKNLRRENIKKSVLADFREFISKGNAVDLTVGVIIGAAFTGIVNSMVRDIITPVIGVFIGGVDFSKLRIKLPSLFMLFGKQVEPPVLNCGAFFQAVLNFFVIAACVFLIVRFIHKFKVKIEQEILGLEKVEKRKTETQLLEDIYKLLKERSGGGQTDQR